MKIKTAIEDEQVSRLTGHEARVTQISFSPDASHVVTIADDDTVRLWEVATGDQLRLESAPDAALVACSSIDQLMAVIDHRGTIRVWEYGRAEAFRVYTNLRPAQDIVFSPTRREFVVTDIEGWVTFFQADNGNRMWLYRHNDSRPSRSLEFSPDGHHLADVRHNTHHVRLSTLKRDEYELKLRYQVNTSRRTR